MSGDDIPTGNDENEVLLDSSYDSQDEGLDEDDTFIPPQEDPEQEPAEKKEKSIDLMATLKGVITPLASLVSQIQGIISSLIKKKKETDDAADDSNDATSAIDPTGDAPADGSEDADPAPKKGKPKKEKKEKPVKEKKLPPLVWLIIILLLIPGSGTATVIPL